MADTCGSTTTGRSRITSTVTRPSSTRCRGGVATDPRRSADDEYRSLNRISLEDLQRALLRNGFAVAKLKLLTQAVHVPPQLAHRSLIELGVGGIELLASPV